MTTICLHLCHSTLAILDAASGAPTHSCMRDRIESSWERSGHVFERIALPERRAHGPVRAGVERFLASRYERAQALQFP